MQDIIYLLDYYAQSIRSEKILESQPIIVNDSLV